MRKKKIIVAVLMLGLIVGYVVWSNFLKTAPSTSKLKTEDQVGAIELMAAYENSETLADSLYLNKILEVTGKVVAMAKLEDAKPTIDLKTDGFGVIKCTLESVDFDLSQIKNEEEVRVKGECIGYLLDVLITNTIVLRD